jgi:PAS domain S-box-containing protein
MEASARVIGEIVERRWMQDVLRQNQEQLRSLIQYAPVAIAMFDRDMRYIVASGRWAADYEREMDDLVGRSHYDVFTDLPEAWRGVHQRAMAGEYITNDDDLWVHADGTLQWLRWVVLPWRDAQGEMGGIIISSEDITERRQLELERRKFFLLAESSSEFIGMCDLDMQPLYVNPAGRRMVGLPDMAAACSVKVQDYYFPEDQKFIAEEFFPRVLREGHGDVEIRLRHFQTGEPIWMFYYLYSVHDFSGNAIGWATVSRDITERRQAEAALRESEERFRTIMASMRDIVFTLDRDQRHTGVYGPWVEQIGMTPEQFLGKNAVEILGPEAGQAHVEANERALQGEFVVYNWSVPTPEGVRYYQTSLSPITDESGQVQGLVGVGRDLTDIRRAEEERAKSHELLTRLAEQVPGVVYQYQLFPDGRSRFPYASPGIWDIYEVTPEEVREDATPVFGRLHPEDYDRISAEIFESARTQELFHSEFRVLLPSQGVRWRLCDAKPTLLEDGSTLWHGIISDITERKRVEAELAESEARYRQLVSSSPYAVVVHQDEHVVYVNPAAVRLYGAASSDEILGRHVSDFMTPEGLEEAHARFRRLLAGETGVYPAETCYQRLDGSQVIAEVTAAPFSYNGRPAVQFLALNVTERRKAEQERDRLQEQLNQAQKMESVGRLAGGVAHDFNNMLSVIIGNTDLAMDEVDPHAPLYADLSEIRKAAERSANLTRQLLAFARKQTIAPRVLDLNETVTSMLRMLQRLIGEDIDLVWKPGRALWPIKMDPAQVDQILANLAVNARDAIAGVGNLTIETENVTFDEDYCAAHAEITPGDYVMLAVSDTGCGMDKATQQHLFEPFFTTKDVGKGTGLGLATIYGIVRQNNGLVNVYSEPGEGTTFRIYLPRVAEADVREAAVSAGRPAGGTETVLIVEDELAILKLGEAVLRRLGYTALAARTPAEALALAAEHDGPIHLLITDVVMPEMNGRDLQLRVKALRPDIKMLYMSGYTANVIAHHGVLDEGVRFMQKPFSVRSLGALVREVLDS